MGRKIEHAVMDLQLVYLLDLGHAWVIPIHYPSSQRGSVRRVQEETTTRYPSPR